MGVVNNVSISSPLSPTQWETGISVARFCAMCMIIMCHIVQRDNISLAFLGHKIYYYHWLNVGVQCFLFISGYLYGNKRTVNILNHYKKCFSKILVDYYLYIIPLIFIIVATNVWSWEVTREDIFKLITFSGHTQGFGHLWFIKNILFCYLMTPILLELISSLNNKWFEFKIVAIGILFHVLIIFLFPGFKPACFVCFWLGMAWSQAKIRNRGGWQQSAISLFVLLLIVEVIMFFFNINVNCRSVFIGVDNYCHNMLGISIVMLICSVCNQDNLQIQFVKRILKWSDKYSYDVYLVHFVFFWSPLDVLRRIDNRLLAIVVALLLTFITASLIHSLSYKIRKSWLGIS